MAKEYMCLECLESWNTEEEHYAHLCKPESLEEKVVQAKREVLEKLLKFIKENSPINDLYITMEIERLLKGGQ